MGGTMCNGGVNERVRETLVHTRADGRERWGGEPSMGAVC